MGPEREQMERLKAALEEKGRRPKPLRRSAVLAAAVCAALMVTVAASSPTVRELLSEALGGFEPYSQSVEGVSAVDQGIEVRVVSAMADSSKVVVYAEVRDLTGDRLRDADVRIGAGIEQDTPGEMSSTFGSECLGYDSATKTLLFRVTKGGSVPAVEGTELALRVGSFQPGYHPFETTAPLPGGLLTDKTLRSRVLESGARVLEPGQTPAALEGTDYVTLSSMGFASDGKFHILFQFSGDVLPERSSVLTNLRSRSGNEDRYYTGYDYVDFTVGGVFYTDAVYSAAPADLPDMELDTAYGLAVTEESIKGGWVLPLEIDYLPELRTPLSGEIGKVEMKKLILSPLSLSIVGDSGDTSCLLYNYPVAVMMRDGTVLHPKNEGSVWSAGAEGHGNAFDQWEFDTPADIGQVTGVAVGYWMIPIENGAAGEGYWLSELP